MIRNYIITAWRNLVKNKFFSFINIFGLSVGLACCMFIVAYLYQELNYDTYPEKAGQIYRVALRTTESSGFADFPMVDGAVGPGIQRNFPDVLAQTRLNGRGNLFLSYGDKQFKEQKTAIVDANFLQFFSLPLLEGDMQAALKQPNTIVIDQELAKKYFGNNPALGQTLKPSGEAPLTVTGVIAKIPEGSHFHFNAFISRSTYPLKRESWSNVSFFTYVLLRPNADPAQLETNMKQLVTKYVVPEIQQDMGVSITEARKSANNFNFFLQPLTDIHLHSTTKYEMEPSGDIHYVYIFGALALFILLLACINFTNLSTASSAGRSREIGIRKVLGSSKAGLVVQFLTESVMLSLLAMIAAIWIIYLLLPYFNELSGKQLHIDFFLSTRSLLFQITLTVLVGLFAGIYPAFFLSSFHIISVLKGGTVAKPANRNQMRSGLIVFQFAVSTSLIIATMVVYKQLNFMQNKKLGYDKEHVIVLNDTYLLGRNEASFKQQLLNDSRIANASISQSNPTNGHADGTQIFAKDIADNGNRTEIHTNIYHVDSGFIPTLNIEMLAGRNFSPAYASDSSAVVINQAAAEQLGWGKANPIGKVIVRSGTTQFTVIGVTRDFNYSSAKLKVAPLILILGYNAGSIIIKTKGGNDMQALLNDLKQLWRANNPAGPLSYDFLDENYKSLYVAEQRTGGIFTVFAIVAIIIGSLGLFGIAAFVIRQRVKEIGIRKVLGASSATISNMLSAEFLKLVLIAIVISFPVTWFAMSKWLQEFAYRIEIPWTVFLFAGSIALAIAFITVSFQSVRAAISNPVKSLRSE